jgi:hypothetical protein
MFWRPHGEAPNEGLKPNGLAYSGKGKFTAPANRSMLEITVQPSKIAV